MDAVDPVPTVLTIDDEAGIRQNLSAYLEDCGYRVLVASNGRAGLELFHQQPVDLILADLRMPEVNGLQVLEQVREVPFDEPREVADGIAVQALFDPDGWPARRQRAMLASLLADRLPPAP